jgi:hypothetical protein
MIKSIPKRKQVPTLDYFVAVRNKMLDFHWQDLVLLV